jgi:hypothetical protein
VAKIDADVETLTYATNGEIFEITPLKKNSGRTPKRNLPSHLNRS